MAKKVTLASLAAQIGNMDVKTERGFAAVATDIADLRGDFKSDFSKLRTELKDDIAKLRTEMKADFARVGGQLSGMEAELRDIKKRLSHLEESVAGMKGFARELDDLSRRITAIENHLGLNKKIAA